MIENTQNKIESFNDVEVWEHLTVSNSSDNQEIEIIANNDIVMFSERLTYTDEDGKEKTPQTIYFIHVSHQKNNKILKLSKKNLVTLRSECQGDINSLIGMKFKITHSGSGKYKHIVLTR